MSMKKEKSWFRKLFTEEGDLERKAQKAFKKHQDELAKRGEIISKLPPHTGFDGWQETHRGYRMQRLSSMMRRNMLALVIGLLVIVTLGLLCVSYVNATLQYNAVLDLMEKIPDQGSLLGALISGVAVAVFSLGAGTTTRYYGSVLDKFYDNSRVYDIHAKNFLNERWHIRLYNGHGPELEPIGKAALKTEKVNFEEEVAKIEAEIANPPTMLKGKLLTEAEMAANKIVLTADLEKYKVALQKTNDCLEDRMTLCSIESRDHNYVWSHHVIDYMDGDTPKTKIHGVLEKEIGWKLYLAVPGPNLISCTGENDLLQDVGFREKLLTTYEFAACVDLPTHPDIIQDEVSGNAVIVDIPILGVRDTPNGGAYYDWDEAGGLLASRLLNYPLYTAVKSESDLKDGVISSQELRIQKLSLEGAVVQVPQLLRRLGLAVDLNEVIPMADQRNGNPVPQPSPGEVKVNNSVGKTALIASACIALLGIGGLGIATVLSMLL